MNPSITMITSEICKNLFIERGADLCGIASVNRFSSAPKGFHPSDIFPSCKSVIVFASHFPKAVLHSNSQAVYTLVRNQMVAKVDCISFQVSDLLSQSGCEAIPIPSTDPYEFWNKENSHGKGILSLKHAAVLAGLGKMGKNTLLITEKFGNMIWLGAVLVDTELEPDPVFSDDVCLNACTLCLDVCPQNALDGTTIVQKHCRAESFSYSDGGGWIISCYECRKVCPNAAGLQ